MTTLGSFWGGVSAGPATTNSYVFLDERPLTGTNLYRLRQIDLGGRHATYGPVSAEFAAGPVSVYPNPTSGVLYLSRTIDRQHLPRVTTLTGETLRVPLRSGNSLDVSQLPPGVYWLAFEHDDPRQGQRFVKK